MIKCAEIHCHKTVHAENTFCFNHAFENVGLLVLAKVLERDGDLPDPKHIAPVLPPRTIWDGIFATMSQEKEGGK
jgi:hypothetical protein